ncbi:MAG: iron-containing alcohol dehydrogenase [Oscillospiraceae bacterium]|nr:iron-containing alcohol dehydrogenase [Oscillospiraceae bacterium]
MIPEYYEFQNKTKILSGKNALENIAFELLARGAKAPAILTNSRGLENIVTSSFEGKGLAAGLIRKNIPADAPVKTINQIAADFKNNGCDSIVAIGGGSVIDTAKGLYLMAAHESDDVLKLSGSECVKAGKNIPFIAVPTTSGAGSEATLAAVIADEENGKKLAFLSYSLVPDVAVLDVKTTKSLPPKLAASTGMDALTHAIEAYTCLQKNPLSDAYATAAISLIGENLPLVVQNPTDDARLAMANASLMAGVAFSNSMVGIVHAVAHACGGICKTPHANAVAVLLTRCMEFNLDVCGELYAELLLPFSGPEIYASTPAPKRAVRFITETQALLQVLHRRGRLPLKLSECGITAEKLPRIAAAAINDGAILLNRKEATEEDIMEILIKAM